MKDRERILEALLERDLQSHFGAMLSGFIHNINGPLHNISLLVDRVGKNQHELNEIIHSLPADRQEALHNLVSGQEKRIQQLVQQVTLLTDLVHEFRILQEVVRNQPKVDLKLVLKRLADVCRCDRFVKYEVNVELDLDPHLPLVPIPGNRLVPALMHLFRNALNAVRESEQKRVVVEGRAVDDGIRVVFRDSGCGFNPSQQEDAFFEVFYMNWPDDPLSGEDADRHAGMGLYAVRELLAPYGARVSLQRDGLETLAVLEVPLPS